MKNFNMHGFHKQVRLECDQEGRLYDHRLRALVAKGPRLRGANLAAIEALAAMRMAGHGLLLLTDRWAEKHGLSDGRLQVLFVLRRSPDNRLALGEIADTLHVSPRNVTGLIDALERDHLVQRVPDPDDRRSVQARLTEAGLGKIGQVWRESFLRQVELTRDFSPDELAQLRHLCLRLVQNMSRLAPAAARKEEIR
jgi:DNA-binding MarR family transcriptional regulator